MTEMTHYDIGWWHGVLTALGVEAALIAALILAGVVKVKLIKGRWP